MHQILRGLFLGNLSDACNRPLLSSHHVDALVSCCMAHELRDLLAVTAVADIFLVEVEDTGVEDIGAYFRDASAFVAAKLKQNVSVLIHCRSGVSRSAAVAMAYLIITHQFLLYEAFFHVRARRQIVCPNVGFMQQLCNLERQVFPSLGTAPRSSSSSHSSRSSSSSSSSSSQSTATGVMKRRPRPRPPASKSPVIARTGRAAKIPSICMEKYIH